MPNLKHLSLLKNPVCPFFDSESLYDAYRSELI